MSNNNSKFNIHLLDKYMLNANVMESISRNGYVDTSFLQKQRQTIESKIDAIPLSSAKKSIKPRSNKEQVVEQSREPTLFIPREHDSLFWSFYVLKHGIDGYENMHQRNVVVEKALKIEYIEQFRINKGVIKANKCGPLHHIENSLLNERHIDLKALEALCFLENVSCVFVFDKCFYEINMDNDDTNENNISMIVKKTHPEKYGYMEKCDIEHIRNTRHKVDNISKPIKAMTSYKMDELTTLCKKLDIPVTDKMRKKQLYEEIVKVICV